jgi:hypothetical protein
VIYLIELIQSASSQRSIQSAETESPKTAVWWMKSIELIELGRILMLDAGRLILDNIERDLR